MGIELVVLIGVPCSGKTTLAKSHYSSHYRVNLDSIHEFLAQKGTRGFDPLNRELARSIERQIIGTRLSQNMSVVIDNASNVYREKRSVYFAFAHEFCAEPIAVYFPPDREECVKMNWKRKDETGIFVPNDVIYTMIDGLEPPTLEEGFTAIRSGPYLLQKRKEK